MAKFALEGPRWAAGTVTWSFAAASPGASPFSAPIGFGLRGQILAAFAQWHTATGLLFQMVPDSAAHPADLRIGFTRQTVGSEIGRTVLQASGGAFLPGVLWNCATRRSIASWSIDTAP